VSSLIKYRADIDGLRAVAIVLVLIFHIFPEVLPAGFIGVDLFFVISGYLITNIMLHQLDDGSFSLINFYKRRIRRLYPSLLVVLVACYIGGWFLKFPEELVALSRHILGGLFYIANFTLWQESGYFDSAPLLKPIMHLWSLSIEEQFYLTWPVALIFMFKRGLSLATIVLFSILVSFVINIGLVYHNPDAAFYFPLSRFWEMMIGCYLSILLFKGRLVLTERWALFCSWGGLLLLLLGVALTSESSYFPGFLALFPTVGAALLILSSNSFVNQKLLSNIWMVRVGLISYPLYLWHWPLVSFVFTSFDPLPYQAEKWLVLIASILLAWITYQYVEKPIRFTRSGRGLVGILLGLSMVLALLGGVIIYNKGFSSRFVSSESGALMPLILEEMLLPGFGGHISKEWREHDCFLAKGESAAIFKQECGSDHRPDYLIWGDSHAATLYYGFASLVGVNTGRIAQYTASACPPLLNWSGVINRLCKSINDEVFKQIKRLRPKVLIIHAAWYWGEYSLSQLFVTLSTLKKSLPSTTIVLLGSPPNWKESVVKTILRYFNQFGRMPHSRTTFGLDDKGVKLANKQVKIIARKAGVAYFSIYDQLCNQKGCLLYTGDSIKNITSLDSGHLSATASRYVAKMLAGKIIINNQ
jgi:peptidoglycan/LPS O-acetylase OafA/YrhL